VQTLPSKAQRASVSRIVNLTKPDFKRLARRFLRWRAKQPKPKPRFRQILANALRLFFAEKTIMAEEELPPGPPAQLPEIVDPTNVPVAFVDWFITGGEHEGVVNVALGTIDHSLKKPEDPLARVLVASRLRFSRDFAIRLHTVLGNILSDNPKGHDPGQGPPAPPKNLH
jgi:hypothetical protein